jgi:hypothetical protein
MLRMPPLGYCGLSAALRSIGHIAPLGMCCTRVPHLLRTATRHRYCRVLLRRAMPWPHVPVAVACMPCRGVVLLAIGQWPAGHAKVAWPSRADGDVSLPRLSPLVNAVSPAQSGSSIEVRRTKPSRPNTWAHALTLPPPTEVAPL